MDGGFWKWAVAMVISLWMSITISVHLLILFMAIDFLTGLLCAVRQGSLSSRKSFSGMLRKTAVLVVVGTTYLLQHEAMSVEGFHIAVDLAQTVALAYVWNELVSILENCVCMGAPIPRVLSKLLESAPKMRSANEEETLS